MKNLTESEAYALDVLKNLKKESSKDVWSALANTTDEVLVAYLVDRVGFDKVIDIANKQKET